MPTETQTEEQPIINPVLSKYNTERAVALAYQKRRHSQWDDNYTLYRDFVHINRLTQRQAVNIPLMKETIKTLLAEMDEAPSVYFKIQEKESKAEAIRKAEKGAFTALEKEYHLNEYWDYDMNRIDLESIDIQDKKNALLYGRSFIKLNWLDGFFDAEVLDIYDVVVDPKMKPGRIESARFLTHQNIYKSLSAIMANEKYDAKARKELQELMLSEKGLVLGEQNQKALEQKKARLEDLGTAGQTKEYEEMLAGADLIVTLAEHYTEKWNSKKKKFERYVQVMAQDKTILYDKPLKQTIGVNCWPFVTWAEDLDVSDVWTDGEADVVRVINKVINAWISQGVENRTLRNYGMRYYDMTKGFNPQSFTPVPWGWYPVPGNPNDLIKDIPIEGLSDAIPEINFLISLIEKATATPPTQKGMAEKKQITLGEIQLVLGKAIERVKGAAKFYRMARREFARKWLLIIEANMPPSQETKLFKTSFTGNIYERTVSYADWKSKAGFKVQITSTSEQEEENALGIQKLMAIRREFPDNPVLKKILEKRLLEMVDITPDEIKEVIAYEEQKLKAPAPSVEAPAEVLPAPMKPTTPKRTVGPLPTPMPA